MVSFIFISAFLTLKNKQLNKKNYIDIVLFLVSCAAVCLDTHCHGKRRGGLRIVNGWMSNSGYSTRYATYIVNKHTHVYISILFWLIILK